jgi:hypothetical protein
VEGIGTKRYSIITIIASESEAIQLVSGEGRASWFNTRVGQSREQPNINWIASQARDDKPAAI